MRAALVGLVALMALAVSAGPALAHGDAADVAAKTPARTLVQQALALMTQQNNPAEAEERLEAALKSKKRDGVQISAVRDALDALEAGDSQAAIRHMRTALRAEEAKQPEATGEHGAAGEGLKESEVALGHEAELDPGRGTAEWIALAVGIILGLGALGLLAARRREAR